MQAQKVVFCNIDKRIETAQSCNNRLVGKLGFLSGLAGIVIPKGRVSTPFKKKIERHGDRHDDEGVQ
jgi:hypothetical protein